MRVGVHPLNRKEAEMTYRICGINVNIVYSDPEDWASGGMGRSCQITNRITLRKGLESDVEGGVLLHEVIHMIADMNNLSDLGKDEVTVAVFANSLNAFLRDNDLEYWRNDGTGQVENK